MYCAPSQNPRRRVGSFKVQGQGFVKHEYDHGADCGASSVTTTMASNSLPADSETETEDDITNPMLADELAGINRTLEKQIETLRLRLEFDRRHHDSERHAIITDADAKLKSRAEEIDILKRQINVKDATIRDVTRDNEKRDVEIAELRRQIESLNNEVECAKSYADELVSQLCKLTTERDKMEKEGVYGDNDHKVNALKKEIGELRLNLATLETELSKAREVMNNQNNKLRFADSDKKSLQLKFKEELARVSGSMRLEVEKMRDVMKKQWDEMRTLREQNFNMSKDIKDIRSLLINGCLDDDTKIQQQQQEQPDQGHFAHQVAVSLPQTARGGKQSNGVQMAAIKPSLPVLNKDKKSNFKRK